MESKEDMKKRGLLSPDRGDAILGCVMCGSHMTGTITASDLTSEAVANSFSTDLVTGW